MRQRDRAEEGEIEEDVEAEEEVEEGKKGINGKRARQMGGGDKMEECDYRTETEILCTKRARSTKKPTNGIIKRKEEERGESSHWSGQE